MNTDQRMLPVLLGAPVTTAISAIKVMREDVAVA